MKTQDPPNHKKRLYLYRIQAFAYYNYLSSGERGIRTPGPVTVNGFQDRRIRPLCHLSGANIDGRRKPTKSFSIVCYFFSSPSFSLINTKLPKSICIGNMPIFTTAFLPRSSSTSPTCHFLFIFTLS